ncbi:hypothetical protein Tco_0337455 [Tanacetum coccineum]
MVKGDGRNQFRQYAGQNVGNQNKYNAVQNVKNQVVQNAVQNLGIQNVRNQNGLIVVSRIANQNPNRNGNVVAAQAEGNANRNNGNQIRCYNCRGLAAANLDEIEEVNANYILMANLQQASTSGTQTDKAPVYDSDGSAEVSSVEQSGGTVDQHPATVEETRAYFESLYNNLAIKVEKVNMVNQQRLKKLSIHNSKSKLEIILHQQRTLQLLKQKKLIQTQEEHSNKIQALNVDALKVDLVVKQNTCYGKENSTSEIAFNKLAKESSLDSETKDVHVIKYKMSKEKERCMTYFRSLHSHLQVLSKEDLNGTHIEHGFKRAFMSLLGQYDDTFTSMMLLNLDQLQKHLDKEDFQEDGSMETFWVLNRQFQKFIDSQFSLDYDSQMTDKYFVKYTRIEMQTQESKINMGKALDANLVITESSGMESEVQDESSRSGNDTDTDDADIRPIYDEDPMAKFASQVDVNNNLSRLVTQHYLPKRREFVFAKPDHMIASSESRNSSKNMPRFSSNDMVHNHYLDEARKKIQERDRNSKTSVMPSARFQSTVDDSKPKSKRNNQTPRSLPVSKSSYVTITVVPKVDHSKSSSSFLDSKHFVCSTCHKCVFNANHDACITKLLKEVNSSAKIQSYKTRNSNKPIDQKSHTQKPGSQIITKHRFSPNKTSSMYEKTSPRSDLRWKPTGRIFKSVSLRWIPIGNVFDSCTSKVDSEPPHGSNVDISNIHECKQTLDVSAGTSINVQKEQSLDLSADTLSDMIVMKSMIELESLFGPLFEEYLNGEKQVVSKSSAVTTTDAFDKRQQQPDSTSSTSTLATTVTADGNFNL